VNCWDAVESLVAECDDPRALRAHGLHLVAARSWRAAGRPIPAEWKTDQQAAAMATLAVPVLIERIRAAVSGPILLFKGPEIAARYPDRALRPSGDLDLLMTTAEDAQRALRTRGFVVEEAEPTDRPQHLPPLRWPGLPLAVEIHHAPPFPHWGPPPPLSELLASAVPSQVGIEGVLAPSAAAHAVLVAAHAWLHYGPCPRVRDIIDVAVLLPEVDLAEADAIAKAWGLGRVWDATVAAVDDLRDGRFRGLIPLRWLSGVAPLRERSVLQEHVGRWSGGLWAPQRLSGPLLVGRGVMRDIQPWPGESWGRRRARLWSAARHATVASSTRQRG